MVPSRQVVAKQISSLGERRGPARADKPGAKPQSQRVGVIKIQEHQGKGQGELAGANFQDPGASAWTAFCSLLVDKLWKESGSL